MSKKQEVESEERLARPLIRLAKAHGVATSYNGQQGEFIEIDDDVLIKVLAALGVDASTEAKAKKALSDLEDEKHARLVEPTVLHVEGAASTVTVNHGPLDVPQATITLEDGTEYKGTITTEPGDGKPAYPLKGELVVNSRLVIPADLPLGYHTLHVTAGKRSADATLISAPKRVNLIKDLQNGQLWGWMAQLYSIRSKDSWGVGDFYDLGNLLAGAKTKTGADFILINPVHAAEPVAPLTPSPYLPISRRFINFSYIRPEAVEEYDRLDDDAKAEIAKLHDSVRANNTNPDFVDRDAMWNAKVPALWLIFKAGRSIKRQKAFDAYVKEAGGDLEAYATWCLCYDKWGAPEDDPESWENRLTKDSKEVKDLRKKYPDTLEFYKWLEWIADEQLTAAQKKAQDAGMKIGLMADMAVGVHPQGAEVWWNPQRFAKGATVGAPPDFFNQQGQNWSQPPLNPIDLANTGYQTYRDMVHGMFQKAGAVRIDHVLGLFRLWWIPQGNSAKDATYVYYDSAVMLGILALEAYRANGVVVGEDLGVVPDYVADSLKEHGLMGCVIEWYAQDDDGFVPPKKWREYALASVTTHDMPPTAGYLNYEQVKIRQELGLLTTSVEEFQKSAEEEHNGLLDMLENNGYMPAEWRKDEASHEQDIIEAMHVALCDAPSKLLAAAIVDGVGERRAQNQPGTNNEYPNWRVPLADGKKNPILLDDLYSNERLLSLADTMNNALAKKSAR